MASGLYLTPVYPNCSVYTYLWMNSSYLNFSHSSLPPFLSNLSSIPFCILRDICNVYKLLPFIGTSGKTAIISPFLSSITSHPLTISCTACAQLREHPELFRQRNLPFLQQFPALCRMQGMGEQYLPRSLQEL